MPLPDASSCYDDADIAFADTPLLRYFHATPCLLRALSLFSGRYAAISMPFLPCCHMSPLFRLSFLFDFFFAAAFHIFTLMIAAFFRFFIITLHSPLLITPL